MKSWPGRQEAMVSGSRKARDRSRTADMARVSELRRISTCFIARFGSKSKTRTKHVKPVSGVEVKIIMMKAHRHNYESPSAKCELPRR